MKFTVSKSDLKDALRTAKKAVPKKAADERSKNVLITAGAGSLRLLSSNPGFRVEVDLDANVGEPGSAVVRAEIFADLVSALGTVRDIEEVRIEKEDKSLWLRCGHAEYRLNLLPQSKKPDYHDTSNTPGGLTFSVPGETLAEAWKLCKPAAGIDGWVGSSGNVLFQSKDGTLAIVATDSIQLSAFRVPFPGPEFRVAMLSEHCDDLLGTFDGQSVDVTLFGAGDPNRIRFSSGGVHFTAPLAPAMFPDYEMVVPKSLPVKVEADRAAFFDSLSALAPVARRISNRVSFSRIQGGIKIEAKERKQKAGRDLDCTVEGPMQVVDFNYKNLANVLSVLGTESVALKFGGSQVPATLEGVGESRFLYLALPLTPNV